MVRIISPKTIIIQKELNLNFIDYTTNYTLSYEELIGILESLIYTGKSINCIRLENEFPEYKDRRSGFV